jgi:hypothetical protein
MCWQWAHSAASMGRMAAQVWEARPQRLWPQENRLSIPPDRATAQLRALDASGSDVTARAFFRSKMADALEVRLRAGQLLRQADLFAEKLDARIASEEGKFRKCEGPADAKRATGGGEI